MNHDSRSSRKRRLERLSEGPFAALTILDAQSYLADYPRDVRAWILLGVALADLARYDEAERALATALDFCEDEDRCWVMVSMGTLFRESGRFEQAASWYRQAIEAAPEEATFPIYLGAMLAKQGRFAEAEAAHRAATACTAGHVEEAYFNLGLVLRAQERFEEAAACFREAIRREPGYREARQALRDVRLCLTRSGCSVIGTQQRRS
jgi:Flp pilus assembly protein TadD